MAEIQDIKLSDKWNDLSQLKRKYTDIAETCSEYTIPSVFTEKSFKAGDKYDQKIVNGYMSKLINNLIGKLVLTILPSNQTFFKLSASKKDLSELSDGDKAKEDEINKMLASFETEVIKEINRMQFRATLFRALKIAMITGDCLIERTGDNTFREFTLKNYCIRRDNSGTILELIIKEKIDINALPDGIEVPSDKQDTKEPLDLYTYVRLEDGKYIQTQSIDDNLVGKEVTFKDISEKYMSIRWNRNSDEDYGRGFVEEHISTIKSLNAGLEIIEKTGYSSSKIVFCVDPTGLTDFDDFLDAENGTAISGRGSDISVVTADKSKDLSILASQVDTFKKELSEIYLVGSSAVRDAERVTAKEIQMLAQELEVGHGGLHTGLATDIQEPLIKSVLKNMNIKMDSSIDIVITSGIEALGRSSQLQKINNFMNELGTLGQIVGSDKVIGSLNIPNIINSILVNSGVAGNDFLYTEMEANAIKEQAKKEELARQMLESSANSLGNATPQLLEQGATNG